MDSPPFCVSCGSEEAVYKKVDWSKKKSENTDIVYETSEMVLEKRKITEKYIIFDG